MTWLVAGHRGSEALATALDGLGADAIAVQSICEDDAGDVAAALGLHRAWARSHYPRSRLLGGAVGLAVLSPHRITSSTDVVVSEHSSTWSSKRRIAQIATIERADHSGYRVSHTVAPTRVVAPVGGAPVVTILPAQVGVDDARAVELPESATRIASQTSHPIAGVAPLLAVTFEMPWVHGDFAVR